MVFVDRILFRVIQRFCVQITLEDSFLHHNHRISHKSNFNFASCSFRIPCTLIASQNALLDEFLLGILFYCTGDRPFPIVARMAASIQCADMQLVLALYTKSVHIGFTHFSFHFTHSTRQRIIHHGGSC